MTAAAACRCHAAARRRVTDGGGLAATANANEPGRAAAIARRSGDGDEAAGLDGRTWTAMPAGWGRRAAVREMALRLRVGATIPGLASG